MCVRYMDVRGDGSIEVCGGKELGKNYLLRLIKCMDQLFLEKHRVTPALVGDVDLYVFKQTGKGCQRGGPVRDVKEGDWCS